MRRTKLSALAVLLLAVLALTAAGCGGGGSKNSAATTEAATTEAATTEEATTEATTTSPIGGLVASGKCKDLANLGQKYSEALSGAGDTQNLKKTAEVVQKFADEAPSEIKDDFKVVADYLTKVADVVGNIKPGQTPDAATLGKLQKLSTEVDAQKLTQAGNNITAWVSKNCKA
jgi:hypothetical protein